MLACEALAGLFDSKPFSTVSIEGRRWGAHLSMLDKTAILMVVFDQQTNIDLVKKRVRRACGELADAVAAG
jgi:predicted regulator of Ras-like GTPase activity (Roadblock/LC7/MglB family)